MATIDWENAVSGLFSTAADWNPATVPGSGDDAVLGALGGAAYTVTAQNQAVNNLQTASNATLLVASGDTFQMIDGTGAGANAGQISVANNSYLYLGGTVDNTSTVAGGGIVLNGAGNNTELRLTGADTTFTGGGSVVMGTGAGNYIFGNNGASNTLSNVNDTFSGTGNLGDGSLTMVNETAGVVNANQTGALTLNVNGGVTNTGLLESTNTGGLFILNTTVDNTGNSDAGKISATGSGSHVDLQNAYVLGGTLSSGAGAQIDVVGGQVAYLDGSQPGAAVTITSGTNVNVNNNSSLYLYGAIDNAGTINLLGNGNNTELRLVSPVTTLTGAGSVVLDTGADNYIFGNNGGSNELDNVNNTISGVGNIGNAGMALVNETAGVIDANQTGQLTLQVSNGVTNTGLLEATNTGGLFILNTSIDDTQNTNAGKITATGAGAHVDLQNSTITGGALTTSGTGAVIDVVGGQVATFDGSVANAPINIATGSTVQVNNNSILYLRGTIENSGVIDLGVNAEANNTEIRLNGPTVTIQGGGKVDLSNSSNNYIFGNDNYSETLDNVDNTIQGSGDIGNGDLTLINGKKGIIDANQANGGTNSDEPGQLVINVNGGVTNDGLMESSVATGQTSGGDLFILNTTVNDTGGGKIEAVGTKTVGSTVDLQNSTIEGGSLLSTSTSPGSVVEVVSGQVATLDGTTKAVTVTATLNVLNNSYLYLKGAITTTKGTINLESSGNGTAVRIDSTTVTLSGSGKINLGNNANNFIDSANGIQQLANVNNTIEGAGNVGNGSALQILNETAGVINANLTTAMTLQTSQTVQNTGTIESDTTTAGAGGLFVLNSTIDNTIPNASKVLDTGIVSATGTGHVDLQNSNIIGGTLTTTGSAVIDVVSGQAAGLNGSESGQQLTISTGSQFVVNNNATLYLYGTINNEGTITDAGTNNTTDIRLNNSVVTLTGSGKIVLSGGTGNDRIIQNQGNEQLNNVNNTISGGGQIGAGGQLFLDNETAGVIDATLAGGIAINLGGVQMINAGLLAATGSNLSIANGVYNTGTIEAAGANVDVAANLNGTGAAEIFKSSTLEIGSSVGATTDQTVTFESGATGTFKIDSAQSFNGSVAGFGTGDTIDLANVAISPATLSYAGNTSGGVLTVTDGNIISNITLVGNYTQSSFHLKNDGNNDTDVTYGTGASASAPGSSAQLDNLIQAMASAPASQTSPMAGFQAANHVDAMHPMLAGVHG